MRTRRRTAAVAAGALLLAGAAALGTAGPAQAEQGARACGVLQGYRIPAGVIGLPTRGGEVTATTLVAAGGTGAAAQPEHCKVTAALHPVDRNAPDIVLQVALPTSWNRKAVMFGGGGYDGTVPSVTGNVPFAPNDELTPLGRGYVTFASDSGHQAVPGRAPTPSLDGSFMTNDEALHNFSGDALKKTHDAAMAIVSRYYDRRSPVRTYFAGGSTGGREALAVAQRFARDFDGVISVYPAWNAATLDLDFGYIAQQFAVPGAFPRPAQQALLYDAVMAACDGQDGAKDGVISNEAGCRFDPATLRCPDGTDTGDTCLADVQIRALRAVASPVRFPYRLGSGETGYPGFPVLSGAKMAVPVLGFGSVAPASPMPDAAGYGVQFWDDWVRYAVTRNAGYDSLAVDPLKPGTWRQRISALTALQDVNKTDLSTFAGHGGKLIITHGTADELVSHRSTVDYYKRVVATMGQKKVDSFLRFYLIPGANHANLGAAFAAGWDSLTALDTWVNTGRAPVDQVVTDTTAGARRTRPLCAYPTWPRYNGTGDLGFASSFHCVRG
jgi:hypothetical protein